LQVIILLLGVALLLRRSQSLLPRLLGGSPSGLTASPFTGSEIFLSAACAFGGAIILQVILIAVGQRLCPPPADGSMGFYHVLLAAGFQFGLLAGLIYAWHFHLRPRIRASNTTPSNGASPTGSFRTAFNDGIVAFLVAMPLVWLASWLWQNLLERFGIDAPPQDIVLLFARRGDFASLAAMIVFAVFVAPVVEELLFRVGLFRWLRGRVLRTLALLLPAVAFGALHGSLAALLPLIVLSIVFSIAYERSGRPGVPIIAHALFNLNSLALLLAGFPTNETDFKAALDELLSFLS